MYQGGFGDEDNALERALQNPCVLGGGAFGVLTMLFLAVNSLDTVPPLNYGIKYNKLTKYADVETIHGAGRRFIGPWNKFILFPSSVQNVEFSSGLALAPSPDGVRYPSLHTRTQDGLALHLHVALQYQLRQHDVGKLFAEFSVNYEAFFISQARDALIKVAAEYTATDMWKRRKELGQEMQNTVGEVLSTTYADVWGLQVLDMLLPDSFSDAIVLTQVTAQNYSTMQFAQNATVVRAETKVVKSEFDRKVKEIRANGTANATLTKRKAMARAKRSKLEAESTVVSAIKDRLHLGPMDLVGYQQFIAVNAMPNASIMYGFSSDAKVLLGADPSAMPGAPGRMLQQGAVPVPPAGRRLSVEGDADDFLAESKLENLLERLMARASEL